MTNTHQCPTCKDLAERLSSFRAMGGQGKDTSLHAEIESHLKEHSKEPQQPKEDKLSRIQKICYTANYDNHRYPDATSILMALHDVIYEDCKDCARKRDYCSKHKETPTVKECTCLEETNKEGVTIAAMEWPKYSNCPIHGAKKETPLTPKGQEEESLYEMTLYDWIDKAVAYGHNIGLDHAKLKSHGEECDPIHAQMKQLAEEITPHVEDLFNRRLESLREELKALAKDYTDEGKKDLVDIRAIDRTIDKEKGGS